MVLCLLGIRHVSDSVLPRGAQRLTETVTSENSGESLRGGIARYDSGVARVMIESLRNSPHLRCLGGGGVYRTYVVLVPGSMNTRRSSRASAQA